MAKNRNNRFDKIREKIDKRTPSRRKIKEKDYSTENTFMADAFPVVIIFSLIACCALFYFLFNTYKEVLVVEQDGFFIDSDTLILGSKKTNQHVNEIKFVNVKENDLIYKNAINHYVDSSKEQSVNVNYPLFIDKGLSFINYNENINLINHEFERSVGYSGLLVSYGRVFDLYTHTRIDEEKYLLLSYEDDVMINLYDMKVKTFTNEYVIPVNSFVYFEENSISYYERVKNGFKYNIINDVDFESLISFSYESALEYFEYDYEKFLKGIDTIYIKDFVIEDVIEPDKPLEEIIPPSDNDGENIETEKPEFVWKKPVVTISDITPSVYTLTGNIKIIDNAHVIVKEPTFTFYRNNKTFLRRTYYSSGEIKIAGLIPSTTFTMVGTYTYLAQDMETRIAVTFYSKEITTGSLDSLPAINMSFVNGQIYPKKVEVDDVKVDSDLESEAISGVNKISLNIGDKVFYLSNSQVVDIINGRETLIESPESLNSSSKIDYEFKFVDREGNELKSTNTTGTTRTSKRHPNVSLRVKDSQIDSVTIGINIKNEDDIEFHNYMYVVKKSDGSIIKQDSVVGSEIVLTDLDPDQLFNIVLYADYDIDDGNGLSNHQLAGMDFTSKPITTLGYINLPMEVDSVSFDKINFLCNINERKTNSILIKLLKKLRFDVYDEAGERIVDSVLVEGDDIENLRQGNNINVEFDYLKSFTKYKVVVTTIIQQGSTIYEIGTTQGIDEFMTNKIPASVNITNPFTTETMIDFDISIEDIDHAIESPFVRLELRDKNQNIVNTRKLSINAEPERITYNNLNTNEFYNIYVYADGYNETNLGSNYKSKYLMFTKSIYTESGISGKIELISSLRNPTGKNIADVKSQVKWLQMYNDKNIPKTVDKNGNMHIYSKNGSAAYTYDLSDYHGQIVTASFKIKAIVPLNEAHKIYFTQYYSGTSSATYSKELTGIPQDSYKEYTFSFKVGAYSSLKDISTFDTDAAVFTPIYSYNVGQNYTDSAGFFLSNGTGTMSEYEIKDFEIHIQYDKEVYKDNIELEQGSVSNVKVFDSPEIDSDFLVTASEMIYLEGKRRYSFEYVDANNDFDIVFYLFDKNGKYIKSYGWANKEYTFYVPEDRYARIQFRYKDGGGYVRPDNIENFKIYSYDRNDVVADPEYKYELVTQAKINLNDKRDEITNDDYYIKVYENGVEYKSYNYVELKDSLSLNNIVKNIELEEGKEYTVELGILIRDRYYSLSTFEISTKDEVLGISTLGDWDKIQPYGNYILLNDLDFQNYTTRRIGVGYRYFHGVIDFQGYTMKQATAKTDGTSNTAYYRIYRIESDAVLKNLVLDVQLNNKNLNDSVYGFVQYNYGTIENVIVNITDTKESQMPQKLYGLLTYYNGLKGKIRNFVVKLENDLHYYAASAVLARENYGLIENGYVYGGDVIVDFALTSGSNRELGILTRYSGPLARINHVFMDVSYQFPLNNTTYDKGGIMVYSNAGRIENSYVIGDTNINLPDIGPIIQTAGGTSKLDNVYYFSDYIYTSKIQDKASFSSLHDISFQQNVLGDGFNIEEMISLGYFPQVKFSSNKMPSQDFVELPSLSDSDYADIVHMDVVENNIDSAKIKVTVDNPYGEDVTEIVISNLSTHIDSQTFADGKSTVMITVRNPSTYESRYMVSSITTTSSNGYKSTRKYQNNELFLKLELFRKIYTVEDFMTIKNMTSQNFMIMNDLDFSGYSNYYVTTFSGVLDGAGHTLKNIRVTTTSYSGLMTNMNGTVKNLNIENFYKSSKTSYHGLFGTSNSNGKFSNVHIKNSVIEVTETMNTDTMRIGALVGQASQSIISYCSASNVNFTTISEASNLVVGGLVGRSSGAFISNSFVQDVDISIENSMSTLGVGGLVGQESSSSVGSIDTSYATGRIVTNGANVGGIVGNGLGYVRNSYSTVDIVSDMSFVGGIAGSARASKDTVERSLYLGNIYSGSVDIYLNRIVGNYESHESNYAMSTNLVNGQLSTNVNGEKLLDYKDYLKPETYQMIFDTEAFDYSKSGDGILPKLYAQDGETLLPNQNDNYLYVNMFNIQRLNIGKYADYATIVLTLDNPDNFVIESIKVEDAFADIQKNVTENNTTQIELEIRPDKYLDSYRISEFKYRNSKGELVSIDRNIRLDTIFYKSLKTYDDWQQVSSSVAENYTLDADIDFTGKTNIKTNVMFNRLESTGMENGVPVKHTLKGIDLNYTKNGNYHVLIQKIATSLKNVNFEDIEINDTSTGTASYVNVIMYNYGSMENVSFKDITINAPNENYVAPIGRNHGYNINNVTSDHVVASGNTYVSGLIAYTANTSNDKYENIHGINLDIQAKTHSVGGLFGMYATTVNIQDYPIYLNMSVKDSKIHGTAYYVGGIVGYGDCNYCHVDNVEVTGNYYVGGVVGHFRSAYQYGNLVENSHVSGTGYYIGGVYGHQYHIYDMHVKNTKVEGLNAETHSIGGISGYRNGYGLMYRCGVLDSNIINAGERAGGLVGRTNNDLYMRYSYVTDTNVTAYDKAGGAVGEMVGYSYLEDNRISNTNVVANNYYAGGFVGYYNNDGLYGSYTEGYVREDTLENVNVQANHYAGGLFGAVNADLYYGSRIRKLYFSGTVKTLSGSNAGIATGDKHNIEVMEQPRIYAYDKSLVNGVEIKDTAGVSTVSDVNLLETLVYLPGYVNSSNGTTSYNENDVNAIYSELIEIKDGKSYVINVDYLTRPNAYNVYLYTADQVYVNAITSTAVDSYISTHHTTSNYDNIVFTAYKDCYLRIAITSKSSVNEITMKEIYRPTVIDKNKLVDSGKIREVLTWVEQTSSTQNFNASLLNFSRTYWDYTDLQFANYSVSVTDKTANKYNASGYVGGISSHGAMFQANEKHEQYLKVNNYKFPNNKEFTINAKFNNYSSRSYAPIFSVMNSNGAQGFAVFSHALQLCVLVGNKWYSTGYYIPYISDVDVTVTYRNKSISLYVDGEFIKTISTVDVGDLSSYDSYIGYSQYYNNSNVSYNFIGHILNLSVFDRVLDENEIRSNYNSSGITNTQNLHLNYDFTSERGSHDAYYMHVKTNSSLYPLQYQRDIPMPKSTDSFTGIPVLLNYSLSSPLLSNYVDVYSSGINTINVEFTDISKDLIMKYRIGDNEYKVNVDRKVYTLNYDYVSDIEIELSNTFETKVLKYSSDDLSKKIAYVNKNYYHIDSNGDLYKNNGLLVDNATHIYDNLALLKDGNIYNLNTNNIQSVYSSKGILGYTNPLRSSVLNDKVINTYYNFTIIDNEELDGQMFIKDSHAYMFNSTNTLNDNVIYGLYNTEEYQIMLNKDGTLESYKAGIKYPNSFVNDNIKEITFDYNSKDTIIMIRYDSGNVLAFNYITGNQVFSSGSEMSATLFEYLSSSLSSQTYSLTNSSKEYKESKKFIDSINTSNDDILNTIDKITNKDNTTSNILDTEYISVYNNKTNKFDIYNVNELVTSKKEQINSDKPTDEDGFMKEEHAAVDYKKEDLKLNVKPLNNKVESNFELYEYFYDNNNDFVGDKRNIIYGIIIGVVIINLFVLSYVYNKKEKTYEE